MGYGYPGVELMASAWLWEHQFTVSCRNTYIFMFSHTGSQEPGMAECEYIIFNLITKWQLLRSRQAKPPTLAGGFDAGCRRTPVLFDAKPGFFANNGKVRNLTPFFYMSLSTIGYFRMLLIVIYKWRK